MAVAVEMPKLGNTVEECLLARWVRHPGERVSAGDLVAEIETDKATFEILAPAAGTLLAAFFDEGELVPVFQNLCVIGEQGEDVEPFRPTTEPAAAAPAPLQPIPSRDRQGAVVHGAASPRARRYAAEHGIETHNLPGSGPGGRVLETDVKTAPRPSPLARKHLADGYELRAPAAGRVLSRDLSSPALPLSRIRETIARRMREALAASAQYTLNSSADATGLLARRARIKETPGAADVNINEIVMFCAVRALGRMPDLNVELADGKAYRHDHVHLGFACDTPRGLLVPVVRDADTLSLEELSARVKQLTAQALEGTVGPDDLAGATFTVSNLGSLGIESFTPVLVPPQVALLGVNTIEPRPVRRNGAIEFVDRIGLSLTCDHQWIDGAPGARFLQALREEIEKID